MGTYNYSVKELSEIIFDVINNIEGDFDLSDLEKAMKIAYAKIAFENIELEREFSE
jgi:hypothetical protein